MTVAKPDDGPLPAGWVETGPPNVTIETEHGAVQLFHIDNPPGRFLCVDVVEGQVVDGAVDDPLIASVVLDEDRARILRDSITAWLDAPRLAARETAEVVAEEDGVRLLKTSAGEWGVAEFGHFHAEEWDDAIWTADESVARGMFARLRGKVICECGAEVDADDATSTDDGDLCPECSDAAREGFKASRFRCPGCGWEGTGSDILDDDSLRDVDECPRCETAVEGVVGTAADGAVAP